MTKKSEKWKSIAFLTAQGYRENEIGKRAASLTYYLIFAIFPFLIFVSSLLGFLHLPMLSLEGREGLLPADVAALLNLTIAHMTEVKSGAWMTFGLVFSIWFPLRAVRNMMTEISRIYHCGNPKRRTGRVAVMAVLFLVFVPVVVMVLLIGDGVLEFVNLFLPLDESFVQFWTNFRFVPVAAAFWGLICMVYYLAPSEPPKKRYILPGAVLSVAAWVIFSVAFSYYVDHMGRYSLLYGSIGTVIAFLVWLNWSNMALLMGAVFNEALRQYETGKRFYL